MDNIFKHTSRSYYDVYNAFTSAYPKYPTWLFKEMSAFFDFQSELLNRHATDLLYPKTRESAYAFAARCDYAPTEADGAITTLTITLTGNMAKTLAIGYQVGGISAATGNLNIFELTAVGNSGGTDAITVAAKQKKTYTDVNIGIVDNSDDFADYPIYGYTKIIKSSISLTINSLAWTRVDNFDDSTASDRHFILIYQSFGKCRVGFGDGTTGLKPTLNQAIYATFEITEGLNGVMDSGEVTINVGGDSDITAITNAATSGGNNAESIAAIIRNARANARLRNAVWSKEDLETAASAASSSVQKPWGVPSLGAASIYIIPSGGGAPGAGLKTTVETYVKALTQFGAFPITALDPNYVSCNVTADITVRDGYVSAKVQDYTEFAMTLATCAYDNQVLDAFNESGVDTCRTAIINVLWAWAFDEDDNNALEYIIEGWIDLLDEKSYREWGQDVNIGDLWIMGERLGEYGLSDFSLTAPAANVTVAVDEIADTSVVTINVV